MKPAHGESAGQGAKSGIQTIGRVHKLRELLCTPRRVERTERNLPTPRGRFVSELIDMPTNDAGTAAVTRSRRETHTDLARDGDRFDRIAGIDLTEQCGLTLVQLHADAPVVSNQSDS